MSYNNGPKPKLSRDEKKAKRRSAQNAKLEQKSKQEAAHFWQCAGRGGDAVPRLGAAELFASQSTGINFSQYEAIPVTRGKVSEADVAPLPSFAAARPPLNDEPFLLAPRGTKPSRRAASASIMVDIGRRQLCRKDGTMERCDSQKRSGERSAGAGD